MQVASLTRMSSLRRLELSGLHPGDGPQPEHALAALAALPRLEALDLCFEACTLPNAVMQVRANLQEDTVTKRGWIEANLCCQERSISVVCLGAGYSNEICMQSENSVLVSDKAQCVCLWQAVACCTKLTLLHLSGRSAEPSTAGVLSLAALSGLVQLTLKVRGSLNNACLHARWCVAAAL